MQSVLVKERKLSELFPEVINNENERELFDTARIQNINVYKKSRKLEIFIVSDTLIPAKTLDSVNRALKNCSNWSRFISGFPSMWSSR